MRTALVACLAACLALALTACGTSSSSPDPGAGDSGAADAGEPRDASASCEACALGSTCTDGAACTQLTGDTFCLRACPTGNECGASEACTTQSDVSGGAVKVCVPQNECGLLPPDDQDAGTPVPFDGGGGTDGSVGPDGGKLSRLLFGAVGDTRGTFPATASYPTAVITQIYSSIEALSPRPPFVVGTGDYAFTLGTDTSAQLDLYLGARGKYSGTFFPGFGNHECTYFTESNCGPGTADGMTPGYTAFLSKLLAPIGKTETYYSIRVDAVDGSWTSKFVFVAPNAWTTEQATWLAAEMAKPTTYTFVVRHEAATVTAAPGVNPSEAIISKHPYTLVIVGHTHTYSHKDRQVMFGNGGAPKSGTKAWGFGVFGQREDGAIQVDAIDYATGLADSAFRFAVKADGSPAP